MPLILDLLCCILVIAGVIFVGNIRNKFVVNATDYLISDQKTGLFSLTATLVMTELNTGTLLAFSSVGFLAGIWSLISLPSIFLLGLIFYSMTVAKYWRHFNHMTAAHYFARRYNVTIANISALFLFVAMAGFSATYVKSLTLIFMPFVDLPLSLLATLITILVMSLTIRGGLQSVIRTDIISFLILILIIPILIYCMHAVPSIDSNSSTVTFAEGMQILPLKYVMSLAILTIFSYILAPWYSQKLASSISPIVAKKAVFLSSFIIYFIYLSAMYICYLLKVKGIFINNADQAFPTAINLSLPHGILGVTYGVLFCIGATTITSIWNAMVSILTFTYGVGECSKITVIFLTIICAIISLLLGIFCIDSLLQKMILANIPIVALSFALLAGIYWQGVSSAGVLISILIGCVGGVYCYLYYGEAQMYTWYWAIYVVPLIFISGSIGSLLFPEKLDRFVRDRENISITR